MESLYELGRHRIAGEWRVLLKNREGEHTLAVGRLGHGAGRRKCDESLRRHVIYFLHRVEQQVSLQAHPAYPHEVRFGFLDTCGDGAKVTVAEIPIEINRFGETAFLERFTRPLRNEMYGRELAGQHRDRLGRLAARGNGVKNKIRPHAVNLVGATRYRELHFVLGKGRQAEGVMQ